MVGSGMHNSKNGSEIGSRIYSSSSLITVGSNLFRLEIELCSSIWWLGLELRLDRFKDPFFSLSNREIARDGVPTVGQLLENLVRKLSAARSSSRIGLSGSKWLL